jgi:hypothetical protein
MKLTIDVPDNWIGPLDHISKMTGVYKPPKSRTAEEQEIDKMLGIVRSDIPKSPAEQMIEHFVLHNIPNIIRQHNINLSHPSLPA